MRLVGASHFHHTKNHTFMQLFHFVTSHLKKQQWKHKCSIFFNKQPVQSQFWSSSLSELIKYKISVKLRSAVQWGLLVIFYIYLSLLLTVLHVSEPELLNWNALSISTIQNKGVSKALERQVLLLQKFSCEKLMEFYYFWLAESSVIL